MSNELLEIEPVDLKFIVEVMKQSSCSVQLFNKSDNHVAFKVKTTSPRKFCVRPNTGVIEPKSTYNFTVTMQAQRTSPTDMTSKDKFLVQSTVVAEGTTEEDITSNMFARDNKKYVEERKLRVILISPPHSPVLSPINGVTQDIVEPKLENTEPIDATKASNLEPVNDVEELELVKDIKNLKSKIIEVEKKLNEAQLTISKLRDEKRLTTEDGENLQQELTLLRSNKGVRRVQVGFPFFFVCMVALISVILGYLLHC